MTAPHWWRRATSSSRPAPSRIWPQLSAACRRAGTLLFVDGYQGAGQVPVDVAASGVDFYAAGGLKWLLGGSGIAFLYSNPASTAHLSPRTAGWFGHARAVRVRRRVAGTAVGRAPVRGGYALGGGGLCPARGAGAVAGSRARSGPGGDPRPGGRSGGAGGVARAGAPGRGGSRAAQRHRDHTPARSRTPMSAPWPRRASLSIPAPGWYGFLLISTTHPMITSPHWRS